MANTNNPSSDLGNLYGAEFIAASQAGLDRTTRMYGHPTLHLQDQVKAMNFINLHAGVADGQAITPRELVAIKLATAALGLLRAEDGQELNVLATITSEVAALAATFEVVKEVKPDPVKLPTSIVREPVPIRAPAPRTDLGKKLEDTIMGGMEKALAPTDSK